MLNLQNVHNLESHWWAANNNQILSEMMFLHVAKLNVQNQSVSFPQLLKKIRNLKKFKPGLLVNRRLILKKKTKLIPGGQVCVEQHWKLTSQQLIFDVLCSSISNEPLSAVKTLLGQTQAMSAQKGYAGACDSIRGFGRRKLVVPLRFNFQKHKKSFKVQNKFSAVRVRQIYLQLWTS